MSASAGAVLVQRRTVSKFRRALMPRTPMRRSIIRGRIKMLTL
jgi:hypothetical protein